MEGGGGSGAKGQRCFREALSLAGQRLHDLSEDEGELLKDPLDGSGVGWKVVCWVSWRRSRE